MWLSAWKVVSDDLQAAKGSNVQTITRTYRRGVSCGYRGRVEVAVEVAEESGRVGSQGGSIDETTPGGLTGRPQTQTQTGAVSA